MSTTCKSCAVIITHSAPMIYHLEENSPSGLLRGQACYVRARRFRAWEKTKNESGTDATDSFPAKWRLRNDCRSSILTTHHYSDLSSASDWLKICLSNHKLYPNLGSDASSVGNFSTRQTSGSVVKCRLFSQAKGKRAHMLRNGWQGRIQDIF